MVWGQEQGAVLDVAGELEALLSNSQPNHTRFQQRIRTAIDQAETGADRLAAARSGVALRLSMALEAFTEGAAGRSDVAVLLRQAIRTYHRRLPLPAPLWTHVYHSAQYCGLRVTAESGDCMWLAADEWTPEWLPEAEHMDALEPRRHEEPAIGDGVLCAMSAGTFDSYQSEAQKAAVHASLFAAPGSTTLVTLPTGAGKSLCLMLPAWFDSRGGSRKGGTTLVVVPTVALALDQERQARSFFRAPVNEEFAPHSLTSASLGEQRSAVLHGIRNGTLPILFTSPESLMQTALYEACLEAARAGTLTRLVVDEAHLVETWGAGFRTEFQFLATYRRQLLAESSDTLRTLLLSATVQRSCEVLLQRLFAEHDRFVKVGGNRLRPEISYWFHHAANLETRRQQVIESLYHLPRPAILYVVRPDDAGEWLQDVRRAGFLRAAVFTGNTRPDERAHLIHAWSGDHLDLMIATSAFGLGVDKPDIRTIIHACLPEKLDRFYQEVGRGGRDGCSAISLLCATKSDDNAAFEMTSKALITMEKAIPRWESMRRSARAVRGGGDLFRVDTNAPPLDQPDMRPGPSNREWNEHTLLLMERAGLIAITDTSTTAAGEDAVKPGGAPPSLNDGRLEIRVLRHVETVDPTRLSEVLAPRRVAERNDVETALQDMRTVVAENARGKPHGCLAYTLADLYPGAALACGGCPWCRAERSRPYADAIPVELEIEPGAAPGAPAPPLASVLTRLIGMRRAASVWWDGPRKTAALEQFADLVVELIAAGVRQVLLPADLLTDKPWTRALVERLAATALAAHCILPNAWILPPNDRPLFSVATAAFYPPDDGEADAFHVALERARRSQLCAAPLIRVFHRDLYLRSESGRFRDRVEGVELPIAWLLAQSRAARNVELF